MTDEENEFFSFSECVEMVDTPQMQLDNAIVCLECADTVIRGRARDFIVSRLRHKDANECKALYDMGILQLTIDTLPRVVDEVDAAATTGGDDSDNSFWHALKELRQHLNTIFLVLMWKRDDDDFREWYMTGGGGLHLTQYLCTLLRSENMRSYPVKKIVVLIRWYVQFTYGVLQPCSEPLDASLRRSRDERTMSDKPKVYANDLRRMVWRFSSLFSPIFLYRDDDSGVVSFTSVSPLPAAATEAIDILIRKLTHMGYDWQLWFNEQNTTRKDNSGDDADAADALYDVMRMDLDAYVGAFIEIMVVCLPSVASVPGFLDVTMETKLTHTIVGTPLEKRRHCEILLKNVCFIVLRLLKSWPRTHAIPYFVSLLQQRNIIVLILKYLRHDVSALCSVDTSGNDIMRANAFASTTVDKRWQRIRDCTAVQHTVNARNCFSYISMLRILRKVTKHSLLHRHMLVKFRSHEILLDALKAMTAHSEFRLHILKIYKSIIGLCPSKWRLLPQSLRIVTQIFHHVPNKMFENWTDEQEPLTKLQYDEQMRILAERRSVLAARATRVVSTANNGDTEKRLSSIRAAGDEHILAAMEMEWTVLSMEEKRHYQQLVSRALANMPESHMELDALGLLRLLDVRDDWAAIPEKPPKITIY